MIKQKEQEKLRVKKIHKNILKKQNINQKVKNTYYCFSVKFSNKFFVKFSTISKVCPRNYIFCIWKTKNKAIRGQDQSNKKGDRSLLLIFQKNSVI